MKKFIIFATITLNLAAGLACSPEKQEQQSTPGKQPPPSSSTTTNARSRPAVAPKKAEPSAPASWIVEGIDFTKVRPGDALVDTSKDGKMSGKRMIIFVNTRIAPRYVMVHVNVGGAVTRAAFWLEKEKPSAKGVWTPVGFVKFFGKLEKYFKDGSLTLEQRSSFN